MNDHELFAALAAAAVSVAALHAIAPDHWAPFAAVARARGWPAGKTARVTLACGFGHVTVSVLLGLLGLLFGVQVLAAVGERMEALAGLLLIGFGIAYALWGLRHAAGHLHGHAHAHYDHVHEPSRATAWSLFLVFSADPCVAVIPLLFAAAPLGIARTVAIVVLYEATTLATMVLLVLPARAGVKLLRAHWLDHYADATAGASIAAVGIAVTLLGW
jgi:hypothetical protein